MKLRAVLNGIAALSAVGLFYTFAFTMVNSVDDAEISTEYYYNTKTEKTTDKQDTTTAETKLASANSLFSPVFNKEIADKADPDDIERIDMQMNEDKYFALNSYEDEADSPVITPIFDNSDKEPEVTSVPAKFTDTDEDESVVVEAEVQSDENEDSFDNVPDDDDDIIYSENFLTDEPEETEIPDDIKDFFDKMQQEIEESLTSSVTESETTPEFSDSETESTTESTTEYTTETVTESETESETSANYGCGEILTARVDGVVQDFDAYELVCMIVSTEMSPSFSPEALKAQAVAAYSYVKYHNVKGLIPSVLVKRTIPEEVSAAVSSVWGKCCYYNGEVAQTVYSASSAGTTASAETVWGGYFPYLVSVPTPFDAESDPNYGVIQTYTLDEIRIALEDYLGITLSDEPENWFAIDSRVDGYYVGNVIIDGRYIVTGRQIREGVLKYKLKSACFDISYEDGVFTFITYGYGHGVGMSQNGANILAKKGYTYEEILRFYFTGITVE